MARRRIGNDISRPVRTAPIVRLADRQQPVPPRVERPPAISPSKVKRRPRQILELTAIAVGSLLVAANTTIGQLAVLVFGLVVIVRRRGSRPVLGAALFLLIAIPIFQLLGQNGIGNNLAVYVFELLVIGTVLALIEQRDIGGYTD